MLKFMENLAKEAGTMALEQRKHLSAASLHFKNERDLVTDVDRLVENFIKTKIAERFPDHAIFAEESGISQSASSEYLWIIDPIDGTTSFVHDMPFYSVSIGLHRNGKPYAGAIYAPRLDELYSAELGKGATLNGTPIHVSARDSLVNCLAETGFACLRAGLKENNLKHFCRIAPQIRDIRRDGSAALDMAFVAAGRVDFFWEMLLQPYDIAAGEIIILEAGGKVTDFQGGDKYPVVRGIVASYGIFLVRVLEQLALD